MSQFRGALQTPVESYLRAVSEIHASGSGVPETSYYTALSNLLNEVGAKLKPRVRCIMGQANRGAGLPDGGLFTPDQFPKSPERVPLKGQVPSRGVIEVQSPKQDAGITTDGEQVTRYWNRYKQVLVTNLRDFVLVGRDPEGGAVKLETHRLADTEGAFWALAATSRKADQERGAHLVEFLQRAMMHAARLSEPEDVAWFLASYARDAKARIEGVDLPALGSVRSALEEALGLKFEGEKGEHFFRSSLVQTLFYGIFSAWVLWFKQHRRTGADRFDWASAARYLRVPMISRLFYLVADPNQLDALRLSEVLDWTAQVLNRVELDFFAKFQEEHAVQYFYEPFLEAFDPELRKQLGVWYTPPEIVKYMVERVDTVLRQELGVPLGLADKSVYVLDPCCGTGSYLVEVLDRIYRTLKARGEDALLASDLKDAARDRVFGFEILPAPFVVSHLQLGLLLQNLGALLSESKKERAGVYLTNALTGWEPPKGPKQHLIFPELEEERDAAEHVKREVPILVVLGNPPYNGFAGVAVSEERDLSNAYRTTKRAPAPQGQGLNDLYVRFFRMAERRIVDATGRGVVSFISNYSWLDGLSFTGMREHYLDVFDRIWIDCLNGDKYKTGKLTPDGKPDPSVFSTEFNPEGIQVGTAVAVLLRKPVRANSSLGGLRFRNFWGRTKRQQLLESVAGSPDTPYQPLKPALDLGLPFMPAEVASGYLLWPSLPLIFPAYFPGVQTKRDDLLIDIDRDRLIKRLALYFEKSVSDEEMRTACPRAMESNAQFDARGVRQQLVRRGFLPEYVVQYCYRPFDFRWLYWEPEGGLLGRRSPDYFPQVFKGNVWIEARQRQPMERFDRGYVVRALSDNFGNGFSNYFPLYLKRLASPLIAANSTTYSLTPNLSEEAAAYVDRLRATPFDLFCHVVAVLHSSTYRKENGGALRQDWPHIPLPQTQGTLCASAELGKEVASLFETESRARAVDDPRWLALAAFRLGGTGSLDESKHFAVTAGWGHAGKGGVVMPGTGRTVERDFTAQERESLGEAVKLLGDRTLDVYLNESAYWANIPARVWEYTIGGYQVIKKWLSYREQKLLGRPLTKDEVRYVQEMARRIAAILLLEPALDANYEAVKQRLFPW
ncbi:MAG TPA: type ISP restriction/modification enzyme [Terriglobia bacterium]|nr:type ISP restriction/modification enzyme [Terriglobia bacterium]